MGNSPARSVVDVGSIIADTYTIEALIGRGGMGAVFLASHRRLPGKKVAIKLLHAELTDDEVVARFRREALIASQLNHPNIVDVTDFNVTPDGTPYLVLEYLRGESLAARIKDGPMPLEQVLSIVRQVGSAVAAANREGIVHRDLKPQNIFLVPKEVDGRIVEIAKVLDFGISKIRGSQTVQTQESTLLGTPQYMAPEQATGQHALVDERTDVFALGAIVHEMLSGRPAFTGANIPEVVFKVVYEEPAALADGVPGLPPAVAAAVARAMAKSAADRFPSVGAFVEALTGQPLLQVRPGSLPPPEVGFAAGSRHRSTGHDAFAQTMGSVDQGTLPMTAAVPAGTASPPPPPSSTARPTVPARGEDLAPRAHVVPMAAAPADRPRPPRALIAGLALACAVGAAAVAYVVLRPPARPVYPTQPAAPAGAATADAALASLPAPDAAQAATALPAPPDAAQAATAPSDAAPAPAPAPRDAATLAGRPRPPATGEPKGDEPEDPAAKQSLLDAEAALAGGQHERAERLANSVISSPDARPRQRAQAHMLRGIVKCAQEDQEAAAIALRNVRGFRAYQGRLIAQCKRAGVELR
jgi:eukaryotic-like serine/threonine-protein kinase